MKAEQMENKTKKQEKMQMFVPSGAINHSRFSTDHCSADAAVDSRSTVYTNSRRVLVEYDQINVPWGCGSCTAVLAPPRDLQTQPSTSRWDDLSS